jgi:hypothetical protein
LFQIQNSRFKIQKKIRDMKQLRNKSKIEMPLANRKSESIRNPQSAIRILLLFALSFVLTGCDTITGSGKTGVVLAERTYIRSSYAVVAADLLEVKRGDVVEILDEAEVADQNREDIKERWYQVRITKDGQETEGWIETRSVISEDYLEQSRKLAAEDKDIPSQAAGQLRAASNLRLSTDYTKPDNILMLLESGSVFEIVSWKRVPKPASEIAEQTTVDRDDTPKSGRRQGQNNRRKRSNEEDEQIPKETTDLWYKVRLNPSVSPAPCGWIYGKQVELKVPSDIIFYRTGREFVAWRRLDGEVESSDESENEDRDAGKEQRPGAWVILEKGNDPDKPNKENEPDFDRVYVLGYDKYNQEHYTAYRSPDLIGFLPLRVEGQGERKSFTVRIMDGTVVKDVQFSVYKDDKGHLRVIAPPEVEKLKNVPRK